MSNVRHSDKPSVRGYAVTHPPGRAVLPIEDGWDQLLYTARGTMTVASGAGSWTIPPRRALWIPGGEPVEIVNRFPVAVRTLYFATALRALPPGARMIDVTGLVRELLLYAVRTAPLHSDDRLDRALLHLLVDQLHRAPDAALWLPSPAASDAARAAARLITDRPGMPLPEVARAVGASRRTLERAFLSETGTTLGAWRRRSRILGSLDYLAAGMSVTRTAPAVGYTTPSAFVTAFTAELGTSPGRYLRR